VNRIQWGRVIAGGLAAGVVLNLGEWLLHEVILRERMEAAAAAMGMETPTSSDIAIFVAMTFVLGLLLLVRDRWTLLKTITAFTVAHSLTLALATLGVATVPTV